MSDFNNRYEASNDGNTQTVAVAGHDDHIHAGVAYSGDPIYDDGEQEILLSRFAAKHLVIGVLKQLGQNDFEEILNESGLAACVA